MSELSNEARSVLEEGLLFDGPDAERRARVKQRVLAAVGSGALTLGGAASAAAGSGAVLGVAAGAKGLVVGSLLVWFGVGAAAGIGVGGVVALSGHRAAPSGVVRGAASAPAVAIAKPSAPASPGSESHSPSELTREEPISAAAASSAVRAEHAARSEPDLGDASASPPPTPSAPSTLREEAALLQQAQRALAAKEPAQALSFLAEHEQRFPSGALTEERKAAKILALCALGRVAEARTLVRAFVSASPGSVLIPRLQHSCAVP